MKIEKRLEAKKNMRRMGKDKSTQDTLGEITQDALGKAKARKMRNENGREKFSPPPLYA